MTWKQTDKGKYEKTLAYKVTITKEELLNRIKDTNYRITKLQEEKIKLEKDLSDINKL